MVESLSGTTVTASTARQSSKPNAGASAFASSDFETFLKMLTTQIKNRGSAEPDGRDRVCGAACDVFGVEQQVQTNQLLQQLLSKGTRGLATFSS